MVVDPVAKVFFAKQQEDHANCACCDCGTDEASWASVSHGIYLSIGAAGLHRSLGVKVSFVQSTNMDSWRPLHLRMMELGGNRRFREFMKAQGVREDMPIREKYNTRAAKWYRENLRAEAEDSEPPVQLPPGIGHLPVSDSITEAQLVLDRIFAEAPCSASMTSGGIRRVQNKRKPSGRVFGPKLRRPTLAAIAWLKKQDSGISIQSSSAPRASTLSPESLERAQCTNPDFSLDRWLLAMPLPNLFATLRPSGCPNAKRLQTLSSGKMEGFGCNDLPFTSPSLQKKLNADIFALA
jgi:hypothetical protein